MSSQSETPEQRFLETIADRCGFLGDRRLAFVNRFSQSNASIEDARLAKTIQWNSDKVELSSENKLRDELTEIYKVLREKGFPSEKQRGRPREGSLWRQAYSWLWQTKFPNWQQEQSIISSKKLTTSPEQQKGAFFCFLEKVEKKFNSIYLFHVQQPISLRDQYIPIQVMLDPRRKDTESSWGYIDSGVNLKQAYALKGSGDQSRQTPVDWSQVRSQYSRLIVLADPGMGKTTLLNQEVGLATQEALEKLRNSQATVEEAIMPLFVKLPDLAKTAGELFDAIPDLIQRDYQQFTAPILSLLQEKLKDGTCYLLLDALDEVPRDHRKDLIEKLNRFAQNSSCAMTVTSRIVGYNGELRHFSQEVEIVPFNEKQRNQYIKTWFRNAAGYLEDKSVTPEGLIRELEDKPQIVGLAQNSLLLSLICSLYQTKGLTLPTRRSQVYEHAVEFMLGKWRHQRKPITEGRIRAKMRLLEHLAYQFFSNEQEVFSVDDLYSQIEKYLQDGNVPTTFRNVNADDLLTEISEEDGIIQKLEREGDRYIFLHRTFQEYFTAKYILDTENSRVTVRDLVENHLSKSHWHQIFLLIAEMLSEVDYLLQIMKLKIDQLLTSNETLQKLLQQISEKANYVEVPCRSSAVRAYYYALACLLANGSGSFLKSLSLTSIDSSFLYFLDSRYLLSETHNLDLDLDRDLILSLFDICKLPYKFNFTDPSLYFEILRGFSPIPNLNRAINRSCDDILSCKLKDIRDQISYLFQLSSSNFSQYWIENGQSLIEKLRVTIIEHRNIGHDWEFGDTDRQNLEEYRISNTLLVNCLKIAQEVENVSLHTEEEIEERFLLPAE